MKHSQGQPGYHGYEYQVLVTVWMALDLILKRGLTTALEIEPASQEDIEADLQVSPQSASLDVHASASGIRLLVQVKHRSRPWTRSAFKSVLEAPPSSGEARGPAPRTRALALLRAQPGLFYLLITDAEVHETLKYLVVERLGVMGSKNGLPKRPPVPAELTERITILEKQLPELLELEIERILGTVGHVPSGRLQTCKDALRRAVCDRLLGRSPGLWERREIERVLEQHGGLPKPTKALSAFVAPSSFEELRDRLNNKPHALILAGPAGTGKTLVADVLCHEHQVMPQPFDILRDPSPSAIRGALQQPGRMVFYLEDPWGKYKLADRADIWADELPKLLREADGNSDKRFLITSRAGVLAEATGSGGAGTLTPYVRFLREQHYDAASRSKILMQWMQGARREQRDWVEDRRPEIVGELHAPQSLVVLAGRIRHTEDFAGISLEKLLAESKIEAISSTVAKEVRGFGAVTAGIILWAFLSSDEHLSVDRAQDLSIELSATGGIGMVDLTGLIMFLSKGSLITISEQGLRAHPTVIAGLERLVDSEPLQSQRAVSALLNELVACNALESAKKIIRGLHGRKLKVPPAVHGAIDQHLHAALLAADDNQFPIALRDLAELSTARDPASLIVRALTSPKQRPRRGIERWALPSWTNDERISVQLSAEARAITGRFIRSGMPESLDWYPAEKYLSFIETLGWDLSKEFFDGCKDAVGYDSRHVELLFRGAARSTQPRYDELLNVAIDALDATEKWWDEEGSVDYRKSCQGELDAVSSALILDEPSERFHGPHKALSAVVHVRRQREGYGWIITHPRKDVLIEPWGEAIPPGSGSLYVEELRALHEVCPANAKRIAWRAIGRAGCKELVGILLAALGHGATDDLEECLGALFSLLTPEHLAVCAGPVLRELPWPRRAAVVSAAAKARIDDGTKYYRETTGHRRALKQLLSKQESRVIKFCRGVARQAYPVDNSVLTSKYVRLLGSLSTSEHEHLAARACVVLAEHGYSDAGAPAQRLAVHSDPTVRFYALRALTSLEPLTRLPFQKALEDEDYHCRRMAMLALAATADETEKLAILQKRNDGSAPIREALASILGEYRWPDGLGLLCELLYDKRNRSEDMSVNAAPDYHVARAAASALHEFAPPLPTNIVEALLRFLEGGLESSEDFVVHRYVIRIVSREKHLEVIPMLTATLGSQWRMGPPEAATFPLRYAAAWGFVTQALDCPGTAGFPAEVLMDAALHSDPRLASPALLTLGLLANTFHGKLGPVLNDPQITEDRAVLLIAAARLLGPGMETQLTMLRLPESHPSLRIIAWCDEKNPEPEVWRKRLEGDSEVQLWLERIQKKTPLYAALRAVLLRSSAGRMLEGISDSDLHEGELYQGMKRLSLFSLSGNE